LAEANRTLSPADLDSLRNEDAMMGTLVSRVPSVTYEALPVSLYTLAPPKRLAPVCFPNSRVLAHKVVWSRDAPLRTGVSNKTAAGAVRSATARATSGSGPTASSAHGHAYGHAPHAHHDQDHRKPSALPVARPTHGHGPTHGPTAGVGRAAEHRRPHTP
jgi:hypothetical protein